MKSELHSSWRATDRILVFIVILCTVAIGGSIVWAKTAHQKHDYAAGDLFEPLPGLDASASGRTLVMWIDSRCNICTDSMPLYKSILSLPRRVSVVAAGRQPTDVLIDYLNSFGVRPDKVISIGDSPTRLGAVPALILLNGQRRVEHAWMGRIQDTTARTALIRNLQ